MPGKWNYLVSKMEAMYITSVNDTIVLGKLRSQYDRIKFFKGWRLNEMLLRVSNEITQEDIDNYDIPISLRSYESFPFREKLLSIGDRLISVDENDILTIYEIR